MSAPSILALYGWRNTFGVMFFGCVLPVSAGLLIGRARVRRRWPK